ncbi:MAG: hypothetical protein ACE5GU_15295 [Candidatus Scalinduaceae bacterium]
MSNYPSNLPDKIKEKLDSLNQEIAQIDTGALNIIQTKIDEPVSFIFKNNTIGDFLSDYERAQSISFVSRFENLPVLKTTHIINHQNNYYLKNIAYIRHILNEYRSIIHNECDSVYYQNVHNLCFKMLNLGDPQEGTTINAVNIKDEDITHKIIKCLREYNKAIKFVLRPLEFDYIYNGILQHSDEKLSKRFTKDYMSGELNYIFWKHAYLLGLIKELLAPYYKILSFLSFPKIGPL